MLVAPAEIEDGCVEYKRNFININSSKLNHLTAQMNWRINEGNGLCYYYLGVCDNGLLYEHFTQKEIDYSLDILKMMVEGCNSYIEYIIINRIKEHIWLNITIRRKYEFTTEYRILCDNININKLIMNYKKSKEIYYNTVFYNNEKYLFFECCKKKKSNIEKIIDFNLILNQSSKKQVTFDNLDNLMKYIEYNMSGNNININNDNVIFNIIKHNYIPSIGNILFGFLKQGKIINGMNLIYKNQTVQVLSIHNNYIDCTEVISPSTISIRININYNYKMDGYLFKARDQNELEHHQHDQHELQLQEHREARRQQAQHDRKQRRLNQQLVH